MANSSAAGLKTTHPLGLGTRCDVSFLVFHGIKHTGVGVMSVFYISVYIIYKSSFTLLHIGITYFLN